MKVLRIHVRRSFATTAAVLLVATPLLGSCGFNLSTDRVSDNTVGLDDRSGSVDILAAVVVAGQPDAGTFIATLANKDDASPADFKSLLGGSGNAIVASDFDPVEVAPRGVVNLADGGGVKITGSFGAGDVIPLTLGFSNGESLELNVPVVTACEEYLGLDPESPTASTSAPAGSATPSAPTSSDAVPVTPGTASDAPGDEVTVTPSSTPTASGSSDPSEEAAADADAYSCEYAPSTE